MFTAEGRQDNEEFAYFQELLAAAKEEKRAEIKGIKDRCKDLENETGNLKGQLYQRFGNNIYLENDE